MATYLYDFSTNLNSYNSLNEVCDLDTSSFQEGQQVIVSGQGIFKFILSSARIPSGAFVYPSITGVGWIYDSSPTFLVNEDGIINSYNYPTTFSWSPIKNIVSYSATPNAQSITVSITGVTPQSIIFCINKSTPGPIISNIIPGTNEITVYFTAVSTSTVSFLFGYMDFQ